MNESIGTLRTDNVTFMIILVFIVYIFAALTFFPALALGPYCRASVPVDVARGSGKSRKET